VLLVQVRHVRSCCWLCFLRLLRSSCRLPFEHNSMQRSTQHEHPEWRDRVLLVQVRQMRSSVNS
jgi:hypothetical protein